MPWAHRQSLLPLGLVVAAALGVGLHLHLKAAPSADVLLEQQDPTQLYQIGDQEFLAMNSGSNEDLAGRIEKILTKEKILLKQVAKRADKHARVQINIKAGQIGIRGRPGPPGYQGPKGFQGPRGNRGPRGYQGPRGVTGPRGIKGIKGTDGSQGAHGARGVRGSPGPPGPRGRRGREGRRGEEGALGKNGANGSPGAMGLMGNPGPPAWEGSKGPQGKQGPPGPAGYNGAPGISGDMGARGAKGNDGSRGAPGDRGPPGEPGKSQCGLATTTGKQMCCGEVDASSGAWKYAGADTISIDVDTSKCKFTGQPYYFTTLYGDGSMQDVYTVQNIVNPDKTPNEMHPKKFRVWLRNSRNNGQLHLNWVKGRHYSLKWCGFGSAERAAPSYAMCCGASRTKNFHDSGGNTYADISTSGCGWKANQDAARMKKPAPWYFTSFKDTSNGASAQVRNPSVYSATETSFRTYMQELPSQPQNSATRYNNNNIDIQWCAVKPMAGATNGGAGYPCTAPRVLVGAGDQAVQTNHAKICCRKTGSAGWKDAGKGVFLYKEIDISPCNMKKVHVTMVDVRGDEGSIDYTGGGKAFSVGKDANRMKVSIWTRGKYKFYDAERYHWKVQYCLVGI